MPSLPTDAVSVASLIYISCKLYQMSSSWDSDKHKNCMIVSNLRLSVVSSAWIAAQTQGCISSGAHSQVLDALCSSQVWRKRGKQWPCTFNMQNTFLSYRVYFYDAHGKWQPRGCSRQNNFFRKSVTCNLLFPKNSSNEWKEQSSVLLDMHAASKSTPVRQKAHEPKADRILAKRRFNLMELASTAAPPLWWLSGSVGPCITGSG